MTGHFDSRSRRAALALSCLAAVACGDRRDATGAETLPGPDAGAVLGHDGGADASAAGPAADAADAGTGAGPRSYSLLSQTGLFSDAASDVLGDGVEAFAPRFALWSDGATKRRWIALPQGSVIDTSDMDAWKLPVGTKLWKEFSRDGVRLETRLVERTSETEWLLVAFQWREDGSDADAVPDGVENARGTTHDIPSQTQCKSCHTGAPDRVLGFSAVQLAGASGGVDLARLAERGLLSHPPASSVVVPGRDTEVSALGYLHANCGHCHNPASSVFFTVNLELRLRTDALGSVQDTPVWKSAVGQQSLVGGSGGFSLRIAPGSPDDSALVYRMGLRGSRSQMPPLGTELVDDTGLGTVRSWIASLGVPADAGDARDAAAAEAGPHVDAATHADAAPRSPDATAGDGGG